MPANVAAFPCETPNRPTEAVTTSPSIFQEFDRAQWSALASHSPLPLTAVEVAQLSTLGDPIDLAEVDAIYRPLTALLQMHARATRRLGCARSQFLHEPAGPTIPYVIGIAGSVAVGKSTVARLLRDLLSRFPETPRVELLTTDGFLLPNKQLNALGLMNRKGFPESYDRRALLRFLSQVKSGAAEVSAPVYSHVSYDIVPGHRQVVRRPDILIVEGLNVLAPPRQQTNGSLAVSDFFDFSIYVNARRKDIERWYVERFLKLRLTAFTRPESFFRTYADLSDSAAVARARQIWRDINQVNLVENIRPTRGRARLIITKRADHRVHRIQLRKI